MEVILFTSGRDGEVRGALWPGMGVDRRGQ